MREVYSMHLVIFAGVFVFLVTVIFALLQSSELLYTPEWKGQDTPHPIEGHEQCDTCHGLDGESPYPKNHQGWSIQSCTKCHLPSNENSAVFQKSRRERNILNYSAAYNYENCAAFDEVDRRTLPVGLLLRTTQNSSSPVSHNRRGR